MLSFLRSAYGATIAAIIATIGDFLLLYIGNASRAEFKLPTLDTIWLWVGDFLGVVAIPFYAFGYRATAHLLKIWAPRAARFIFLNGILVGLLGALIHGITTLYIGFDQSLSGKDPLHTILDSKFLLYLWMGAFLLVLIISIIFGWYVGLGCTSFPRYVAFINPVLLTIFIAGMGMLSSSIYIHAFLIPAAPNIAHIIFFLVCAINS